MKISYYGFRMIERNLWIIMSFFLIFLCCGRQILMPLEPEDEFTRAKEFFDNRRFDTAIMLFERVIFYHSTSEYIDDAQFYLACAYYEKKDYQQAIVEFDYLIKNFSNSPFIEEAYIYRAKSYLLKAPGYEKDQTEVKEAITLLDEFLTTFPNSKYADEARNYILMARNRLAKKELENGKLYVKIKEYNAAELYFKYVIENYPETPSADEAKYQTALIKERRGEFEDALKLYKELIEKPVWQKIVEKRINAITKNR